MDSKLDKRPSLLAAVIALGVAGGCSTAMAPTTMKPITVPDKYQSDTEAAIQRALAAKHYAVEKEEEGRVVARWAKGSNFYRVAIKHEGDAVDLEYVDSDIETNSAGMAPKQYVRYMKKLRATIEDELGRPQREAAEADAEAAMKEKRRLEEEERRRRAILVTAETTPEKLREAIAGALADRSYAIESEEESTIVARWNKGDQFYRLKVSYDPKQIELQYIDSDHQDDDEEDGVQIVDEKYIDYMRRLAGSIEEAVNGKN